MVVAGSTLDMGCTGECRGPGCEASYPTAQVAVHRGTADLQGAEPVTREVWDDAEGLFRGANDDGSEWSADAVAETLIFGQPEADRVLRVTDRPVAGPIGSDEIVATLVGPEDTRFGDSVVALPDGAGSVTLFVSAPEAELGRGALYMFPQAGTLEGVITVTDADRIGRGSSVGDRLGDRLFGCGDLTGDGLPELAVHIPWFSTPSDPDWPSEEQVDPLAGAVWIVTSEGMSSVDDEVALWDLGPIWWGVERGEGAGEAVSCDRDLSGDALADVVIGSPWSPSPDTLADVTGKITIHRGGALPETGPLDTDALRVLNGPDDGGWFGGALAAVDIGGQSFVAVGAAGAGGGAGRVHLYPAAGELLNPDRLVPRRRATFLAEVRGQPDHFGRTLASGDIDADGDQDLLVGAPDYRLNPNSGYDAGRMWVFVASTATEWTLTTPIEVARVVIAGTQPFQHTGRAPVVTDLDGDGAADVVLPTRAGPAP